MSELDLFDTENIDDLLRHVSADEQLKKWPVLLLEIIDVVRYELGRNGVEFNDDVPVKVVAAISLYFGGRAVYLPSGAQIKAAVRDSKIYDDWSNGLSINELLSTYKLTQPAVYKIIKEQRVLQRNKRQLAMFNDDDI